MERVRCTTCKESVRVRKNGMLYIHGEGEGDGGSCPMSGAPVSVANADQSTNECVHYYVWADDGNGHSGSFCVHCGQEESLSGEPEGQDCPVCGHWVYGDACTEEGCGWKVMRAAGEEDVTVNPQPPERPRMTMREIIDGVRTRGDLAHLSPVDAYETVHGVRPIAVSEAPATVVSMDEKKPDPFEAPATVTGPTGAISYPAEINVSGQPEPARDQWGRYLLPHPVTGLYSDGRDAAGRRNGWTRATTFAKAAADTFSLTRYDERLTLVGATLRPDVVALAHGKQVREDAKELNRLVLQVKEAAGAKVAANIGTAVHGFTEQVDAGHMAPGEVPEAYRGHVRAYLDCLADNGLEPVVGLIERTTFVDQWAGIAGTFDRVLYHRPSNTYLIGDLKTGRDLKYGRMEIAVQLALYAHGINHHGVYDWAQGRWDREMHDGRNIKVRTDFGVVMHLPIQGPETGTCSLKRINLAAGWDAAQVCGNVIASRKRDDYMEDGFVLPSAPYVPETPAVTLPESLPAITWEAAFSNVETKEEASHLWGKAKLRGVDRMELQRLVGLAQQRLRELGVLG